MAVASAQPIPSAYLPVRCDRCGRRYPSDAHGAYDGARSFCDPCRAHLRRDGR